MKGGLDVDSIEVYVWLILFIVLTAIEMATFQLVTIWFAKNSIHRIFVQVTQSSSTHFSIFFGWIATHFQNR